MLALAVLIALAYPTSALATLPAVREYGTPAAYAEAVAGAPGTYVKYDWPAGPLPLSTDMEVDHVWTVIPYGNDTHGNGVFASSQYWFHNATGFQTAGGYMGSQVMRNANGTERRVFIFSCWDSDPLAGPVARVGWTTPPQSLNSKCERFGGEGVGSHCVLDYPTQPGRVYRFRVAFSGSNLTGAIWTGVVTDTTTGISTIVGTLFYPHVANNIGFGNLGPYTNEFLEYFAGGNCDTAVHVGVGTVGPFFHQRTTSAIQAYPAYGTGDCKRASVTACIPGVGCGHPNVMVEAGRNVTRNNSDSTKLWTSAMRTAQVGRQELVV